MKMPTFYLSTFFVLIAQLLWASPYIETDTIAPFITTPAMGADFPCNDNVESNFTTWFNNDAGTKAVDNSGFYTIETTVSYEDALDSIQMGTSNACGDNASLFIGFYAIDSCGNTSPDTSYALFTTFDIVKPDLLVAAKDEEFSCDFGVQD